MGEQIWHQHYDQGVPHTLQPYPQQTLAEVVASTAAFRPDHVALYFKGTAITYAQLDSLSNAFASSLLHIGLRKGERVALLMPNIPQMVLALLGVWRAGGIAVPLNPLDTPRELEYAFQESGAETILLLTRYYHKVKTIQGRTHLRHIIATNIKEFLPAHLRLLFTLFKESSSGDGIQLQPGDHWLHDLLQGHAGAPPPQVDIHPTDLGLLLFSGGTTGSPKAAAGTQQALLISGLQYHAWSTNLLVDWEDVIMLNMPLFHSYGLGGVFATGLVAHTPLVLVPDPRDLDDLLATIQKVKPAFLPGVPTLFNALLHHPKVRSGQVSLKSIKLCLSGASSLLLETKQRFEEVTGGRIIEGYAMTESMMAGVATPIQGLYKPGAVGIPLPDVELRVVDADSGQVVLPAGQVGEFILRAPQIMRGYWGKPTESANAIRDGWLYTGDLGYLDEDGYMFIVDRKKDLIKPSGFQVWPREVEEVLASHPAVAEVGVAGVPDPFQGEAVQAWVVLRSGQTATQAELRQFCRQSLTAYKVPRQIQFVDCLPKTAVGKILRRELSAKAETQPPQSS